MNGAVVLRLNAQGEYEAIPIVTKKVVWDFLAQQATEYVEGTKIHEHCQIVERWTIE